MDHDVFIAHIPKEKRIAQKICKAIEEKGIKCWLPARDVKSGISRAEIIAEAIETCRLMILVFSKRSKASQDLLNEMILANKMGLSVIPVRIDQTEPQGAMQFYLVGAHWMTIDNPPSLGQMEKLIDTVSSFLDVKHALSEKKSLHKDINKSRKIKILTKVIYVTLLLFLISIIVIALLIELPEKYENILFNDWVEHPLEINFMGIRGNSTGNINNLGIATSDDVWIYYSNIDESYHLYKESLETGERIRLNEDQSYFLNISGDWIYYINGSHDDSIYRIKKDGTERMCLKEGTSSHLNVIGEWVFYIDLSAGAPDILCGMFIDGSSLAILIDGVGYVNILGNSIYYINRHDEGNIYHFDTTTTFQDKINDANSSGLIVDKDWIYFINDSSGSIISRINIETGLTEKLNDESCSYLNVADEWLYYMSHEQGGKIVKMRTDGSERRTINNSYSVYINIVGDWIYYLNRDEGNTLYRMTIDGLENRPIGGRENGS
jgi:predicted small secreted protein